MNGIGVFSWPDGRKYTGEFVDGVKSGHGKYEWPDGKCYNGMWLNG